MNKFAKEFSTILLWLFLTVILFFWINIFQIQYNEIQTSSYLIYAVVSIIMILSNVIALKKDCFDIDEYLSTKVCPEIMKKLLHHDLELKGNKKDLTILHCKLIPPEGKYIANDSLDKYLNEYHKEIKKIVHKHNGTLETLKLNIIQIYFENSQEKTHPIMAIEAALEIKQVVEEINKRVHLKFILNTGITSGQTIVGNIPYEKSSGYSITGKNVNVATELSNINKKFDTSIIISNHTYERVKDSVKIELLDQLIIDEEDINEPVLAYNLISYK